MSENQNVSDTRFWFHGMDRVRIIHQEGDNGKWQRGLLYCATSIINVAIICNTLNGIWGQ